MRDYFKMIEEKLEYLRSQLTEEQLESLAQFEQKLIDLNKGAFLVDTELIAISVMCIKHLCEEDDVKEQENKIDAALNNVNRILEIHPEFYENIKTTMFKLGKYENSTAPTIYEFLNANKDYVTNQEIQEKLTDFLSFEA